MSVKWDAFLIRHGASVINKLPISGDQLTFNIGCKKMRETIKDVHNPIF